jgi:hypothetical protein
MNIQSSAAKQSDAAIRTIHAGYRQNRLNHLGAVR